MGTAVVTEPVDASATSATIAAVIEALDPQTTDVKGEFKQANVIRFWKYTP